MGDIADMMLDGVLCEGCGQYLDGEAPGYPRYCDHCQKEREVVDQPEARGESE